MELIRTPSGQTVVYDLKDIAGFQNADAYSLSGADAGRFEITADGLLRFRDAPDLNNPADAGGNGVYDISLQGPGVNDFSLSVEVVAHSSFIPGNGATLDPNDPRVDAIVSGRSNIEIWGDGNRDGAPLVLTWSIAGVDSIFPDTRHINAREYLDLQPVTEEELAAIRSIFDRWEAVSNVRFVYVDESLNPEENIGNIRIIFQDQFATGIAWTPGIYDGTEIDGDITIRTDLREGLVSGSNFSRHILAHEIGHAVFSLEDITPDIGYRDTELRWEFNNHTYSVQSYLQDVPTYSSDLRLAEGPQLLDIKAIAALFGGNSETGAGNSLYQLDEESFVSIYDVSGIDRLDFSGAGVGVQLDLRSEAISRVGASGRVSIASGVVIEQATGTGFADDIRLNDAANQIDGGAGDDIIRGVTAQDSINGGAGFDTVYVRGTAANVPLSSLHLTGVEQIVFDDRTINIGTVSGVSDSLTAPSLTYVSRDVTRFAFDQFVVDDSDAVAELRALAPQAGQTLLAPSITGNSNGITVNAAGQIFVNGQAGNQTFTVHTQGLADQQVIVSSAHDNDYRVDLTNSPNQIDIYDYDGRDRLILEHFDGYRFRDGYVEGDQSVIEVERLDGTGLITIVIHNSLSFGRVEEIVLDLDGGDDRSLQIIPIDQLYSLGDYRSEQGNRPHPDFFYGQDYFHLGRRGGAGAFQTADRDDPDYRSLDNIDEFTVLFLGGDDIIFGSGGSDQLEARLGNDVIYGGSAGDRIIGGYGNDTIYGGDGNDGINADFEYNDATHPGRDVIYAGNGDDEVRAGNGDDWIDLGAGDDLLEEIADLGNDTIYAGTGNDTIYYGEGRDWIDLGAGDDYVFLGGEGGADTIYGGLGADTVYGGLGADKIYGEAGHDWLEGGYSDYEDGGDTLVGGAGNDVLIGRLGDDVIRGGTGNDVALGGTGNDKIFAGGTNSGDDIFAGGDGDDTIGGGDGNDILVADALVIEFTEDKSAYEFSSINSGGHDKLYGGLGNDTLIGGGLDDSRNGDLSRPFGVNDPFYINRTDRDGDSLYGGEGDDVVLAGAGGDYIGLQSGNDRAEGGEGDDIIYAGAGADTIDAGRGADTVYGGLGDDIIRGGAGSDTLYGGAGNDSVYGDTGDDFIVGSAGNDSLKGGGGSDIFGFSAGSGIDIIEDFTISADQISLINAAFDFKNFADVMARSQQINGDLVLDLGGGDRVTLLGLNLNNLVAENFAFIASDLLSRYTPEGGILIGGAEDTTPSSDPLAVEARMRAASATYDHLYQGNEQDERAYFEAGRVLAYLESGDDFGFSDPAGGNDTIFAGSGDDEIYGAIGSDRIYGEAGNDYLDGAYYNSENDQGDTISGGAGSDVIAGRYGDDYLIGGAGSDVILGGGGDDLVIDGDGDSRGNIFSGGDGSDTIIGGVGNDILVSDSLEIWLNDLDRIYDYTRLAPGHDKLYGGLGDDTLVSGWVRDRRESGSQIFDLDDPAVMVLREYSLGDTLDGGAGNDRLLGGDGNDILTGGTGHDVFVFAQTGGRDVVTDFNTADDVLDLSATAFDFKDFNDVTARVSVGATGLEIDLGDGAQVTLSGITISQLSADNFIF